MRCFDGPEQQRRDPNTSRAQRARRRCAYARTGWSAKFLMDSLVTSARESPAVCSQHGYHWIVAPWMTGTCPVCPLARRRSPLEWRARCCCRRRSDARQQDATSNAAVLMCARYRYGSSLRQPFARCKGCFISASARRPLLVARGARAGCCRCRPFSSVDEDAHTALWYFARGTRGSSSAGPSLGARAVCLAPPRRLLVARGAQASCCRCRRSNARQVDATPHAAVLMCARNSRFLKRSR